MKIKGLVLGTAAGALAVTGAQAADLPVAPEPIDYVRVCDAFGPGYFFIPGTDTCLRVAGRIRADYNIFWANEEYNAVSGIRVNGRPLGSSDRADSVYRFRARAYLYMDSRTNTEFGLLRTYTEVYWTVDNDGGVGTSLDNALIQFGGLTFGRTQSFFDFLDGNPGATGQLINIGYSDSKNNLAAYTFAFGNGFTASLSIEDNLTRSRGVIAATGGLPVAVAMGGAYLPDLVAALRVDQGWGSAQLSGVLHNVRTIAFESELGFAIRGGVVVNVPFGSGTRIGLQGAYGYGAMDYVSEGALGGIYAFGPNPTVGVNTARDGVITPAGNLDLTKAFSISGGISTSFTPTISASLNAGYTYADLGNLGNDIFGRNINGDFSNFGIEGFVGWAPVSGFVLGVGAQYQYTSNDTSRYTNQLRGSPDDPQVLSTFFRAQRSF